MLYQINKSTNLSGSSAVGTDRAVAMTANIKNENNQSFSYSITIVNPKLYIENAKACRADIESFIRSVYDAENEMFEIKMEDEA